MRRSFYSALVLSSAILLSGCASAIDGATQTVRLDTPGAYDAECSLNNGVKFRARTGDMMEIQRSRRDLVVDCYAPGDRHKRITVASTINGSSAANVTNGIIPGMGYDVFSGAAYEYPPVITVDFVGVPTRGFETPDYMDKDAPNPYKQAIEGYGASTPTIPEDSQYMKRGWQKRDALVETNPFASTSPSSSGGGMTPEPATTSSSVPAMTPSKPNLSGGTAEELTRSANPAVFDK